MANESESDFPFSQACENNKDPILAHLSALLTGCQSVLEIGGGTGQHALYFAQSLPYLTWHPSDVASNLNDLARRIMHASLENLPEPIRLDVDHRPWACGRFDAVFTANSLHIMSENSVENFFAEISDHMNAQAQLLVYGPFKYKGEFTTPSNASFDEWLKERNPVSGVRDFEWINALAQRAGLRLKQDLSMPANNQLLVWDTHSSAKS